MAILDGFTAKYYEVLRLGIQRDGNGAVVAMYDIALRNVDGRRMGTLSQGSVLTQPERQAIVAIFQRDKAQFEAATGLEEWVEPEEPPIGP